MEDVEQRLRETQHLFQECTSPVTNEDIATLLNYLKSIGVSDPSIPEEFEAMWKLSSDWHLIRDHYNVFGFNVFGPKKLPGLTNDVFGDDSIRQEWEDELGPLSCAHKDWLCFASFSEFDYIFVNLNKGSQLFGATKHMVNNCTKENIRTQPPFSNFINYMEDFIEKWSTEHDSAEDDDEQHFVER